jgi:hypothetical protein
MGTEHKLRWLELSALVVVATLAVVALAGWLVATDTGRDLLLRAGLIYADPMNGLD